MAPPSANCSHRQRGAIYLFALFLVAITGAGLATLGRSWSIETQRDKETALLHAGTTYRRAIAHYYEATPGTTKTYPADLESLLRDPRFPDIRRYLRRIVPDPMTGKADWVLLSAPGGGVSGVASRSELEPLKKRGFSGNNQVFEELPLRLKDRVRYRDWEFVHSPGVLPD